MGLSNDKEVDSSFFLAFGIPTANAIATILRASQTTWIWASRCSSRTSKKGWPPLQSHCAPMGPICIAFEWLNTVAGYSSSKSPSRFAQEPERVPVHGAAVADQPELADEVLRLWELHRCVLCFYSGLPQHNGNPFKNFTYFFWHLNLINFI